MLKKSFTALVFILLSVFVNAQITQDATYAYSGTFTYLTQNGNKFYLMDVAASQCRLYNVNQTPYKTINLSVPTNNYLYDIKYVTENLFTTDNSLCLAYVYYSYNTATQVYSYNGRVVKENGTVLLTLPGCQYIYVFQLADGSTKLVAYSFNYSVSPYTIQTTVYNLPGDLITSNSSDKLAMPEEMTLPAFPNPAQSEVTIPYTLPDGSSEGKLTLFDANGREIQHYQLNSSIGNLHVQTAAFPRGTYIYIIESDNYTSKPGKMILQ